LFCTLTIIVVAALRSAVLKLADQDGQLRMINQELVHRNRNLFAVVNTLAAQTMRSRGINGEITAALSDRMTALVRAQDLTRSGSATASL
jgi:two-component sensor histidine kinase